MTTSAAPQFYVSVVDGTRTGLIAGPFQTHEKALAMVPSAIDAAMKADDRAWFYAFGTCSLKEPISGVFPQGKLNAVLAITR